MYFVKAISTLFIIGMIVLAPLSKAKAANTIEACKKNDSSTEVMSRCLDSVVDFTDKELQTWINLHQFELEEAALVNGRSSTLKMFKRSQKNFTTYRENNCRWQYLAISPNITAGLAYKECYILLSKQRINELTRLSNTNKLDNNN
jgi:uncharacterized protein YecT (DUF1311 family)